MQAANCSASYPANQLSSQLANCTVCCAVYCGARCAVYRAGCAAYACGCSVCYTRSLSCLLHWLLHCRLRCVMNCVLHCLPRHLLHCLMCCPMPCLLRCLLCCLLRRPLRKRCTRKERDMCRTSHFFAARKAIQRLRVVVTSFGSAKVSSTQYIVHLHESALAGAPQRCLYDSLIDIAKPPHAHGTQMPIRQFCP